MGIESILDVVANSYITGAKVSPEIVNQQYNLTMGAVYLLNVKGEYSNDCHCDDALCE